MDRLRTDELKEGHRIKLNYPSRGEQLVTVRSVVLVDRGTVCGIYRIGFYDGGFDLMANADRVFEVESGIPVTRLLRA